MRHPVRISLATALIVAMATPAARAVSVAVVGRVSRSVVLVQAGDRLGTAFAYGSPGYYLTNAHVVADTNQVVLTAPGGGMHEATVVAIDPSVDVARLRSEFALPTLTPAASLPTPGEAVMTVGSPEGLQGSIATGIVSALHRRVQNVEMIQLDLDINPGNSGGPLVDGTGDVLGIVSDRATGEDGIAFAIPIATATGAVEGSSSGSPPTGAGAPASAPSVRDSGGAGPTAVLIVVPLGIAALALLLWRRTRRPGSPEQPVRVELRSERHLEDDQVAVVIRRRVDVRDPSQASNSQPSEETWT